MNILLLTILAVSGAIELAVGAWALVVPASFASTWLGISQLSAAGQFRGPIEVLLFVLGWAGIALSALHVLAFVWLRSEKREAFGLAIGLGGSLAFVGLATFLFGRFGTAHVAGSGYLLLVDGVRGALLVVAGVLAMNAPATVRELRLPPRRDQERQRSRPGVVRDHRRGGGDRDDRRDRERGPGRGRDRDGERRGPGAGRDVRRSEPARDVRGPRGPRDASRPPRVPSADRRDRPSESIPPAARDLGIEKVGLPPTLQPRPLPGRDEAEGDRWQQGRRRPGPPPETEDVRSLGVVVTGRPPQSITRDAEIGRPRVDGGPSADERPPLPRAPMVPRLRSEVPPARPLRPDSSPADADRHGERDRDRDRDRDRRHRRRRRSSSSRPSGDERMRPDEERTPDDSGREGEPPAERYSPPERSGPVDRYAPPERSGPVDRYAPPERSEPVDRYAPPERYAPVNRPEPPEPVDRPAPSDRYTPPERPVAFDRPVAQDRVVAPPLFDEPRRPQPESGGSSEAMGPIDEPIDLISSFGGREESGSAPAKEAASFGHHRRPFTQHRKGRQSKPREEKIRRGLGADLNREQEPSSPPAQPFGLPAPSEGKKGEGRVGLSGGIGPVDLDEGESQGFRPEES